MLVSMKDCSQTITATHCHSRGSFAQETREATPCSCSSSAPTTASMRASKRPSRASGAGAGTDFTDWIYGERLREELRDRLKNGQRRRLMPGEIRMRRSRAKKLSTKARRVSAWTIVGTCFPIAPHTRSPCAHFGKKYDRGVVAFLKESDLRTKSHNQWTTLYIVQIDLKKGLTYRAFLWLRSQSHSSSHLR